MYQSLSQTFYLLKKLRNFELSVFYIRIYIGIPSFHLEIYIIYLELELELLYLNIN
jgi:hypothetical protein